MNQTKTLPQDMSVAEIEAVLPQIEEWIRWGKAVLAHALELAKSGAVFKTYELKTTHGHRKFTDKDKVAKLLLKKGYSKESIYEEQLLSPTKLELLLGKETYQTLLQKYVTQEILYKLVPKT